MPLVFPVVLIRHKDKGSRNDACLSLSKDEFGIVAHGVLLMVVSCALVMRGEKFEFRRDNRPDTGQASYMYSLVESTEHF